ncbi:DUF3099 domain-containing protein [Rathayibacter rathayi]|uniref:DUF3099 domain-containing protein n=1 Tax=Rathayibacter rathayi TaxID=33887 RepID=UPI000CE92850|nr:DUF3099 domain-containing protein [Rathayibacter rathayi]PPG68989.1 DUF3099 domain-containing protein [Rathayibacter rathayi]PPG78600.1 DUF3099 domain-containing protein [Rathayibacter rathayi]PPH23238.1 DUF3099 domain-containing protein [Rathayibacter rathayi]PPI77166.1 DUF3099 domain-containing protein [Rathayibacter rathayi]
MKPRETLTSLPPSPSAERRSRVIKYSIAMSIRMLCVICLLFAHGWWLLFFAIGAVVLPYFAVVLANVGSAGERGTVERPGAVVLSRPVPPPPAADSEAPFGSEGGDPREARP